MINFRDVYDPRHLNVAKRFLYGLLAQRPPEAHITHKAMPTWEQHADFVDSHPYRYWYIVTTGRDDLWVGTLYATHLNALGIQIDAEFHRKGYALAALQTFIKTHQPLSGRPSVRNGNWIANVAMENDPSHNLFHRIGKPIQVTYEIQPCA